MNIQDFSRIIIYEDIEKTGANWLKFLGKAKGLFVNPNKARLARRAAKANMRSSSLLASKVRVPVSKMQPTQISALRNRRDVFQNKLRSSGKLSSKARLRRTALKPQSTTAQAKPFWNTGRKIMAGTAGGAGAFGAGAYLSGGNSAAAKKPMYQQAGYRY